MKVVQGYASPEHPRKLVPKDLITVDGIALVSNTTVRNVRVTVDQDTSFT